VLEAFIAGGSSTSSPWAEAARVPKPVVVKQALSLLGRQMRAMYVDMIVTGNFHYSSEPPYTRRPTRMMKRT
jgi:hypothetical protein